MLVTTTHTYATNTYKFAWVRKLITILIICFGKVTYFPSALISTLGLYFRGMYRCHSETQPESWYRPSLLWEMQRKVYWNRSARKLEGYKCFRERIHSKEEKTSIRFQSLCSNSLKWRPCDASKRKKWWQSHTTGSNEGMRSFMERTKECLVVMNPNTK